MTFKIKPRFACVCAVFSIPLFIASVDEQNTLTISGRVSDPSGAAVAGAEVSALPASGAPTTAATDSDGKFSFADLAPGACLIDVNHQGFENAGKTVNLAPGAALEQTFRLAPGKTDFRQSPLWQ